jgi:hypothetical protein
MQRDWGLEDRKRDALWPSWFAAFKTMADWDQYDVSTVIQDPWVREQLNRDGPRIALIPGNKTTTEMKDFIAQLGVAGVECHVIDGYEAQDIDHSGSWVDAAVAWLTPYMK